MNTFLLEIGLEEMPADVILPALKQLADKIQATCEQNKLGIQKMETFSTPRRLAVLLHGLPEKQEDQVLELKGPPSNIAKDENGQWSKAAQGFAKKNQIDLSTLFIQDFKGKDFVFTRKEVVGKLTRKILEEHASDWITGLYFPKNMRWGAYKMKYVRPIRWLALLWNEEVIPLELEMVKSGNLTYGHRFLHTDAIEILHAQQYFDLLSANHVVADYEKRRSMIVAQVRELEKAHQFSVVLENALLEEVTNLVEWPTVLLGNFEKDFLSLPSEVLVTTMAKHQRYFPVYDQNQALLPHFITVRNGDSHSSDVVVQGNEKVVRARLNDARFFYQEDQKHELEFFNEQAQRVVFFQKRGSLAQRVDRIQSLSQYIAQLLQLNEKQTEDTLRIATLCKFDLQTQLVYEFPDLQGVMGECYARLKGENDLVCLGIREHYHPRYAQDTVPQDIEVVVVALAEKLDMLATAFSLKIVPTGSADPYALRRMAQGVVQLILEAKLMLSIDGLNTKTLEILDAQQNLNLDIPQIAQELAQFFVLRQRFFMQEAKIRYDVIDALLHGKELAPLQQMQLGDALRQHLESPVFKRAVEAIVRAGNISKKEHDSVPVSIDENTLSEQEEQELWRVVKPLNSSNLDLDHYLQTLFILEPVITVFFDKLLVMDKDKANRENRLFICRSIANWSLDYMDLGKIVFAKES
ncbi:MAG: glycine--tRNA ligase subunit beta [SAR324 cluster bacterium]|nr:glycine--tRNA ligase subunit beta [SAR324 cluster bacterium]